MSFTLKTSLFRGKIEGLVKANGEGGVVGGPVQEIFQEMVSLVFWFRKEFTHVSSTS